VLYSLVYPEVLYSLVYPGGYSREATLVGIVGRLPWWVCTPWYICPPVHPGVHPPCTHAAVPGTTVTQVGYG